MRQHSGRALLEGSWVLSRADLTEPEPPRAHGQVHALGSAELSTEALRQPVSEDQHSSRECSETSPDSSSVCVQLRESARANFHENRFSYAEELREWTNARSREVCRGVDEHKEACSSRFAATASRTQHLQHSET